MSENFSLGHWTDEYEELQELLLDSDEEQEGASVNPNIYDHTFSGLASGMYREWVGLEDEEQTRPARLENWHPEDLIAYVGGQYAKEGN